MTRSCVKNFYQCYDARLDSYRHDKHLSGFEHDLAILKCFPTFMQEFKPSEDSLYWINSAWFDPIDRAGITVLMELARAGNLEFVKFLVGLGADVNAVGEPGDFALGMAARHGWQDIFDYLYPLTSEDLQKEACKTLDSPYYVERRREREIYAQDKLMHAVETNNLSLLEDLVLLRADVNNIDSSGKAPLHEACRLGHLSIILKLLDAGADINCVKNSETPLSIAKQVNRTEVADVLLTKGAT